MLNGCLRRDWSNWIPWSISPESLFKLQSNIFSPENTNTNFSSTPFYIQVLWPPGFTLSHVHSLSHVMLSCVKQAPLVVVFVFGCGCVNKATRGDVLCQFRRDGTIMWTSFLYDDITAGLPGEELHFPAARINPFQITQGSFMWWKLAAVLWFLVWQQGSEDFSASKKILFFLFDSLTLHLGFKLLWKQHISNEQNNILFYYILLLYL